MWISSFPRRSPLCGGSHSCVFGGFVSDIPVAPDKRRPDCICSPIAFTTQTSSSDRSCPLIRYVLLIQDPRRSRLFICALHVYSIKLDSHLQDRGRRYCL